MDLNADGTIEVDEEGIDGELMGESSVLTKLLASQSKLLEKLVSAKAAQSDPLALLSRDSAQEYEDSSRHSGIKGIAARQLLVESFKQHPTRVVKVFKERLALARRKRGSSEVSPEDLWMHMQETVPLGSHRTLTYVGFQAAAMFEAMERKDWERVQMLICLQSVFIEQAACDGGSLRLAHLLTALEDPPFAQTESHRSVKTDFSHGQLSDPRWLATSLGYLKDIESITDRTGKFAKSSPSTVVKEDSTTAELGAKAKAKWRPKKPRKSQEAGEEAEG